MSTAILSPEQAAHLQQHGTLLWVVPARREYWRCSGCKTQIMHDTEYLNINADVPCRACGTPISKWHLDSADRHPPPHQPGDVVTHREWLSLHGGEMWVDTAATVTDVRATRLSDVGAKNPAELGNTVSFDHSLSPPAMLEDAFERFQRVWREQHPRTPWHANPVVWLVTLELNG